MLSVNKNLTESNPQPKNVEPPPGKTKYQVATFTQLFSEKNFYILKNGLLIQRVCNGNEPPACEFFQSG